MFRTRLPVASECIATPLLPLDLHVLSLPLAFILSQDQTLHSINPSPDYSSEAVIFFQVFLPYSARPPIFALSLIEFP